ncbi:MAG TPA: hypothetical protein VNN74_02690 [Candidatus Micrarchaeia archaeon]|nr:hypothetical protein [Candidatus Micrarchaeia archaeon]
MSRRWLALYPSAWRARHGEAMADTLASLAWRPAHVLDIVRGAGDAWLELARRRSGRAGGGIGPPVAAARPGRADRARLRSGASACAIVAAVLLTLRAATTPLLAVPTLRAGTAVLSMPWSASWWVPVVARLLASGAVTVLAARLAWRQRWRSAGLALAAATLGGVVPISWSVGGALRLAHGAALTAAAHPIWVTPHSSPWAAIATDWPPALLLGAASLAVCLVAALRRPGPTSRRPSRGPRVAAELGSG